jgi:membrane-associated phospholipid phosphatase
VRWAVAYALVVAAEVVGKSIVHRAPLYTVAAYGTQHVWKFDSSFPSGEAARATLLAGLVMTAWPRAGLPAGVWAIAVDVLLVAAGTHTPFDVAGGLCLGIAAVVYCRSRGVALRSRTA